MIQFDKTTRIVSDTYGVTIQKSRLNKKNETVWDNKSYHPTYTDALHHLVESEVRGLESLEDIVRRINELHEKIDKLRILRK